MKRYASFLLVAGLGLLVLTACDEATKAAGGDCAADISAKFNALNDATEGLATVSLAMKVDVITACNDILDGLGETTMAAADAANPTDDEVSAACTAASAAISAEVDAGARIEIIVQGGGCQVDASAQLNCEAECSVEGECDPGTLEARCDPGELSVMCEGSCEVDAYCEADVAIACSAECVGTCEGTCSGSCRGEAQCEGSCDGTCDGTCQGGTMTDGKCSGTCNGTCS
ncbi:MAG: hypothetical protein KC417_17620, partial [Myxococcales bacterium]|nr:hypothetical protein [Myxococcales bacterium]